MTKIGIYRCPVHRNFLAVVVGDGGSGSRITSSKCCGRWDVVQEWTLPTDKWRELAQLATTAAEAQERAAQGQE